MRIALVAQLYPVSVASHIGGGQEFLKDLGHGLIQRGHCITLFARDNAFAPGIPTETVSVSDNSPSPPFPGGWTGPFASQSHIFFELFLQIQERKDDFDLLHVNMFNWSSLTYSLLVRGIPVLHTLHTPGLAPYSHTALRVLHQHGHPITLITGSHACARILSVHSPIDHIIYYGVPVDTVPFIPHVSPQAPLLCAGRICPEKGIEEAIEIAKQANRKLLLAGEIIDRRYYETRIAPRIEHSGSQITYLGFLQRQDLWKVMAQSLGLLFPICWEEPFGLVAAEAMATGTPVIAFRRGAAEEIIIHGETGFIVNPGDVVSAASFVDELANLSRTRCRSHVATHFPLERMIDAYEQIYQEAVVSFQQSPQHC